jgi:hypothetical protein
MKIEANEYYLVDGVKMKCHIVREHGIHTFQLVDEAGRDKIIYMENSVEVKDWGNRLINEKEHEIKEA